MAMPARRTVCGPGGSLRPRVVAMAAVAMATAVCYDVTKRRQPISAAVGPAAAGS